MEIDKPKGSHNRLLQFLIFLYCFIVTAVSDNIREGFRIVFHVFLSYSVTGVYNIEHSYLSSSRLWCHGPFYCCVCHSCNQVSESLWCAAFVCIGGALICRRRTNSHAHYHTTHRAIYLNFMHQRNSLSSIFVEKYVNICF